MSTGKFNAGGKPAMDCIPSREEKKYSYSLYVTEIRVKCQPGGPLDLYVELVSLTNIM